MLFDQSAQSEARLSGKVFTGFEHPVTGKIHRERNVSKEDRELNLTHLATQYLGVYGLWGTGGMNITPEALATVSKISDISLKVNDPEELLIKLKTAAEFAPKPQIRVNYIFDVMSKVSKIGNCPRVILLSQGDQKNIPRTYWDHFHFWFVSDPSPEQMLQSFENSFDAILNVLGMEARRASEQGSGGKTSRQVFEEIIDQALSDAELNLEPFLSRAPTAHHALTFKTVMYMFLARENTVPDGIMNIMESNARVAPLDYFTSTTCKDFIQGHKCGYQQLVGEGVLITLERVWQYVQEMRDFDEIQSTMAIIHFMEDIAIFIGRSKGIFETMLPE